MRYQKIESQIWHDEKFIKLSHSQQLLFFYILTSPHNNLIGTYVLKQGYICEDLKIKSVKRDIDKLIKLELIRYDYETGLIHIPNFFKHNPLTNPNQHKSAVKVWNRLPKSDLLLSVYEGLSEGLKQRLGEGLSKPETEAEEEEETITEKEEWILPKGIKPEIWELFERHRKSCKGKFTDDARTLNANVLLANIGDQKEIVDNAVKSGWTGLFALKNKKSVSDGKNKFNNLKDQDYSKGAF